MTIQIPDFFVYQSHRYRLERCSDGELFEPKQLGLVPDGYCTACYRGYYATFGVLDNNLVLQELAINILEEKRKTDPTVGPPSINGVRADHTADDFVTNFRYSSVQLPLLYTGGLMVVDKIVDYQPPLPGQCPPWYWHVVKELIFENGQLRKTWDHSAELKAVRAQLKKGKPADRTAASMLACVTRIFHQHFDWDAALWCRLLTL